MINTDYHFFSFPLKAFRLSKFGKNGTSKTSWFLLNFLLQKAPKAPRSCKDTLPVRKIKSEVGGPQQFMLPRTPGNRFVSIVRACARTHARSTDGFCRRGTLSPATTPPPACGGAGAGVLLFAVLLFAFCFLFFAFCLSFRLFCFALLPPITLAWIFRFIFTGWC